MFLAALESYIVGGRGGCLELLECLRGRVGREGGEREERKGWVLKGDAGHGTHEARSSRAGRAARIKSEVGLVLKKRCKPSRKSKLAWVEMCAH